MITFAATYPNIVHFIKEVGNIEIEHHHDFPVALCRTLPGDERRQWCGAGSSDPVDQRLHPRIDFGPTNPNTGGTHHDFIIGAENSRFVDLKLRKSYLRQWTTGDWQKLGNFLYRLGDELYADIKRVTEEDDHDYVFTFWWD